MHRRVTEFVACAAERYGLDVDVREFDVGTKTAPDAAAAVGCDVAQIASSLVFDADGELVVVVTSGANRASEEKVAVALDAARVTMADAEEIRETVGWSIGGVPPLCHETSLPTLVDETLFDYDTVWAAAGTPKAVFPLAPETLCECAGATRADVADD